MDIKKELLKLKRERDRGFIAVGIMLGLCFPIFIAAFLFGVVQLAPIGGILSVVSLILILRRIGHPNFYNLKGEIAGYDKCKALHMRPPRGKSKELDLKISALEKYCYQKGYNMLGGVLYADSMNRNDVALIKSTITRMEHIDKASDEALFKSYAHLCSQASLGSIAKNKHAKVQKECIFRILYIRYYHLLKE